MKVSRRDNLDRYYLLQAFGFGIFVHYIHDDEDVDVFHSHPWNGISLIFGSYLEEILSKPARLRRLFNLIKAPRHHRVTLPNGPVWSVFFHFRRYNRWTVMHRNGTEMASEPWRDVGGMTSYNPRKAKP